MVYLFASMLDHSIAAKLNITLQGENQGTTWTMETVLFYGKDLFHIKRTNKLSETCS